MRVLHRNLLLPCDFLATETQESVPQSIRERRMHAHTRAHYGRDCQPNHNESDSEDGEEDLPGLLLSDLDRLPPPSLTTGQSGCTEDEAMLESMGDGDGTSSSTPEPDKQPEVDPEPEQQPELVPEPEQQLDWEEDQAPSRPQRVRHPPKVFTYNRLGQPTICSVQTVSNLVPRWYYPPFQSPWMLPLHQYHPPPGYGPLVYSPYMQMMYARCTQIYLRYWTFIDVIVDQIMILSTVEFPVFCAAVPSIGKVVIYLFKNYDYAIFS